MGKIKKEICDWPFYQHIYSCLALSLRTRRKKNFNSSNENPSNVSTNSREWSRGSKPRSAIFDKHSYYPVEASFRSKNTFTRRQKGTSDQFQKWHNHGGTGRKTPKKKLQQITLKAKQRSHRVVIPKLQSIDLAFQFKAHEFVCTAVLE